MLAFRKLNSKNKAYVLLAVSMAWVCIYIPVFIFSMVGFSKLSIKLPIGWSKSDYPSKQSLQLENHTYNGSKYIIEPGSPFRYERSVDMALDPSTATKLCGDDVAIVVSKNMSAAVLNLITLTIPALVFCFSSTYLITKWITQNLRKNF
jgi:hypothetical protein